MNNIKTFINNFHFPDPNWTNLPTGFPNLSKEGLSREEEHLLEAIKIAWINSGGGRSQYYIKIARAGTSFAIFLIALISLISLISSSPTKEAQAKTISQTVSQAIESTRSAVLKN